MSSHANRYWLSPDVGICRTEDYFVLLDVKSSRYFGARADHMLHLARQIEGWPWDLRDAKPSAEISDPGASELLQELLDGKILTPEPRAGEPISRVLIERPQQTLVEGYAEIQYRVRMRDIARFLSAALTGMALVECAPFSRLIAHIRSVRSRASAGTSDTTSTTERVLDRARSHVAMFAYLRPLALKRSDACLLNSVALSFFLAKYDLFPNCVFGVATTPFKAHCWLQQGGVVINDTAEHVGQFTPILVL